MLASYLRTLAARGVHGQVVTPDSYYQCEGYCSFYWNNHGVVPDLETWNRVIRLAKRYRQFVRYCREVVPEWREVRQIHWADNSVDSVQVDKDGNQRYVQLAAPSGDRCF